MRLHRLRVENFAGIGAGDVEFGVGLNVLYGPNDLGKSTLAEAIRLALLLPHTSTHSEPYSSWRGGQEPLVELTFQTEPQRYWRVSKRFGKGGSSALLESKDGISFDEVERGRKVDGRLREILAWGIPEPGGAGAPKGLPTSFLATALLSTQDNVTAILEGSLERDSATTGKDRIAAALQAIAQDPLFVVLLREAQSRRDEAYTDKGAKKTAKGSVFKAAADRLNEARDEKLRLEKIVQDSETVEQQLRNRLSELASHQDDQRRAAEALAEVERIAEQARAVELALARVQAAQAAVQKIEQLDADIAAAHQAVVTAADGLRAAQDQLAAAEVAEVASAAALKSIEDTTRALVSAPDLADTTHRQGLELQKAAADQESAAAQSRLDAINEARQVAEVLSRAESESGRCAALFETARNDLSLAEKREAEALAEVTRCELLERAIEFRDAEALLAERQADVEKERSLTAQKAVKESECSLLDARRATLTLPSPDALQTMRKLETELAGARGALNVGFVVTVSPHGPLRLEVTKDGAPAQPETIGDSVEIEAGREIQLGIGDLATVHIKGGRREAQEIVRSLESRWALEVSPHLAAAGVLDIDGLDKKIAEARDIDAQINEHKRSLADLARELEGLAAVNSRLQEAVERADAAKGALEVPFETLRDAIDALGRNPAAALKSRRQQAGREIESAKEAAGKLSTAFALAEERARTADAALQAARQQMAAEDLKFPLGLAEADRLAQLALSDARRRSEQAESELKTLEASMATRRREAENAVEAARSHLAATRAACRSAQDSVTEATARVASETRHLEGLREARLALDDVAARASLAQEVAQHASLPVPDRIVNPGEVIQARERLENAQRALRASELDVQRTHGALAQVGGAVAREQLRDAQEALQLAERHEREIEQDYEAWRLLLEQMKEADAAQANNLGQALSPAIEGRFQQLTNQRYQGLQLSAHLGTGGVLVGGTPRDPSRISVGTREQLATLYRLTLAEYLATTIVLDDQLVQSDGPRMEWFRALLVEKSRGFQILVFTCRPDDYLPAEAMVPPGSAVRAETEDGFIRGIDLHRALRA